MQSAAWFGIRRTGSLLSVAVNAATAKDIAADGAVPVKMTADSCRTDPPFAIMIKERICVVGKENRMEAGITGRQTVTVTEELTAQAMGSGMLPVYATPAMIALMENTAACSVTDQLEEGQGTVGTLIEVKHVSATTMGMEVTCETRLIEVDRKRLVFEVKAYDVAGLIGEGIHERFVIDNEKFMARAKAKKE